MFPSLIPASQLQEKQADSWEKKKTSENNLQTMINIGLWYVGEVPLESGRVLAGASRVLIFPVLRAVIMQALQGAREVLTASGSRRQDPTFYELLGWFAP